MRLLRLTSTGGPIAINPATIITVEPSGSGKAKLTFIDASSVTVNIDYVRLLEMLSAF